MKAKAVLLYHWGVALRKVEKFIKALGLRGSREAIRQWYHRLSGLVEYILKSSQELYVDETKIKGRRRLYYLWLAVDSDSRPSFVYLSRRRDTWTTKIVLSSSKRRVITTDKGWWYRRACRELGLEWRHETFGRKNSVERPFLSYKAQAERFLKATGGQLLRKETLEKIWEFAKTIPSALPKLKRESVSLSYLEFVKNLKVVKREYENGSLKKEEIDEVGKSLYAS